MTIQEAIKSGRPFRRPFFEVYIQCPKDRDAGLEWVDTKARFWPREEDLLATDWETQPQPPRHVWLKEADLRKLFATGAAYYLEGMTVFRDARQEYTHFVECEEGAIAMTRARFQELIDECRKANGGTVSHQCHDLEYMIFGKQK